MKPAKNILPPGWTEKTVREVAEYYDNQTEEESAAEIESAPDADETLLLVPNALVETVCRLIKQYDKNGQVPPVPSKPHKKTGRVIREP